MFEKLKKTSIDIITFNSNSLFNFPELFTFAYKIMSGEGIIYYTHVLILVK